MLPDGDGFDFVLELRKTYDFPVIFMTAKIAEQDRIHGLELGADDYISKPFSPRELVLRVGAVLRRTELGNKDEDIKVEVYRFRSADGVLVFDDTFHKLTVNDRPVELTGAEWRILGCLLKNANQVVSREELIKQCFDYTDGSYGRIADTHIKNIRAKLGADPWIDTVRGFGYRFIGLKENVR